MKTVTAALATDGKPDREKMKSFSYQMVSDLSRLLADKGFGERPIDIVEALVFAMFIIADTYSLAKPDKDKAREVIYNFYDDMQHHFIHEIIMKNYHLADADEIQCVSDKFYDLSRGRFAEYGEKFKQDISDPLSLSCPLTVNYLLENLFIQPIEPEEKIHLMGAISDRVLNFWTSCVQHFA